MGYPGKEKLPPPESWVLMNDSQIYFEPISFFTPK